MRAVLRCRCCKLNQYRTLSGMCRRCHALYEAPVAAGVEHPKAPRQACPVRRPEYDLGYALKLMRLGLGFTQAKLMQRYGAARTYLAKVETGRMTPNFSTIERLDAALGMPPGALMVVAEALCRKSV